MNSKKFEKKCFYLPVEGRDIDLVRQGVFWLFANSKIHGGWLAVNIIKNLEDYSDIPGLNELIKLKNNYCEIINGVSIYLITEDTIPNEGKQRSMLALHPNRKLLNKLDEIPNISQMTVVPFLGKEIEDWINLRNANELSNIDNDLTSNNMSKQIADQDKIVIAALQDLDSRVNLNQNVWEGDVKFGSIILFRILHDNNIDYDPATIKEYLRGKLKWNPLAAGQAAIIADEIRSGNRYEDFTLKHYMRNKFWNNDFESIRAWKIKAGG